MATGQMASLMTAYGVATERALVRAIAAEYSEETGERTTIREAAVILDGMLEAEYQRLASRPFPQCLICSVVLDKALGDDLERNRCADDLDDEEAK